MTALASDRDTPVRSGDLLVLGVTAAVKCYAGALAVRDSEGLVKPGVTGTGLVALGRFAKQADNSTGLGAAITAEVEAGVYRWANLGTDPVTSASIGSVCYLVDDQTVAATDASGTRSPAGIVAEVGAAGVWVRMGYQALVAPAGGLVAANNLSDLAAVATARGNLGGGANKILLTLGPISTKGSDAAVVRVVSPVAGTIAKIYSVLNAALAAGDAVLTGKINATAITAGALTLTQAGSAAGDVDVATPSGAKTVAIGDVISFTGSGDSTAAGTASVSILITPTA